MDRFSDKTSIPTSSLTGEKPSNGLGDETELSSAIKARTVAATRHLSEDQNQLEVDAGESRQNYGSWTGWADQTFPPRGGFVAPHGHFFCVQGVQQPAGPQTKDVEETKLILLSGNRRNEAFQSRRGRLTPFCFI